MNTLLRLLATPLAAALLLAACSGKAVKPGREAPQAGGAGSAVVPFVGTFKVNRFTLDNGLRLLVVEDHSSPTFAFQTWFRVGSRDEVPGRTGLAHLFEHMMFKQTKALKEGEFDRILEQAGAEGENAFTSRDYTVYVQELPKDKLELIVRLEAERMVNLVIDEKSFETERQVVQNERRFRNENSPDGLMYQTIFEAAYSKHSYRWPIIGYQEDLDRMTAKDAMEFYRAYYSPNHATIVVVGDVDPERVHSLVRKHYGEIPGQPSPASAIEPEPQQRSAKRKSLRLNMQLEKLLVGYRIPAVTHEDIPALETLQAVLTGGKSSRLYRALVSTGIASAVDSYDLEDKDPSLFILYVNLQEKRKAAQAEQVLLRELARLAREPVAAAELERAKNRVSFNFLQGLDSNDEKARFLGHFEAIAGGFEAGLAQHERVKAVTALDVQAVVRRYLAPENRTVVTGVPK
jgi:zinc protease